LAREDKFLALRDRTRASWFPYNDVNNDKSRATPPGEASHKNGSDLMIDVDTPHLAPTCAACGTDLMLTPSGHHFCGDPTCTEGFGTDILRQLFGEALNSKSINLDRKQSRHD